ncbi:hypothetical protein D9758_003744 [Tetrapyrgos nigripes]|uniref:DNA 3'-5' helicase n=1 Tax=Tetrapyrgos nigripes TaxID=182062 RepID=A0A8H5GMI1_9AGAR|nr:hypothetical protein D9758_003744 [Tetrapyrgos nigripes]
MAGGAVVSTNRRRALAGESGWRGLVRNRRIFFIAVFASLGGLLYGYNQGVFSGVLAMRNFDDRQVWDFNTMVDIVLMILLFADRMASVVNNPGLKGWKYTIVLAVIVFCIGVIVQTAARGPSSIYGGRFITGLGVGSLSMAVPLYNAELSPPEVRGSLVALQQQSITAGIMISFWIDYGTNFIGGTGDTQKEAAWRIPLALQLVPAVVLGIGILFMPFSPRWLVNQERDDEALAVLSYARGVPVDDELVKIEFLEIKAQYLFEKETSQARFPDYQDGSFTSNAKLGLMEYWSLVTNKILFWRVAIGSLAMFFQQWTGVNAILYYAPTIFQELGLTGSTVSLLATGVVGIAMCIATIPAVIWIDQVGRRPILISGAFLMAACHLIVAILTGLFHDSWDSHVAAGWAACAMVWLFAIGFGYRWDFPTLELRLFYRQSSSLMNSGYLQTLNPAQLKAVRHDPGIPLQILAGPGSGKTKVLTSRIAHIIIQHNIPPSAICAVTFTNKAANEMKERLSKLIGKEKAAELKMGTFHALCALFLRKYSKSIGLEGNFTVCDADESKKIVAASLKKYKTDLSAKDISLKDGTVLSLISKAKAKGLSSADFMKETQARLKASKSKDPSSAGFISNDIDFIVAEIYEDYEKTLRQNNSLDFDDLLLFGLKLFSQNEWAANWCKHVFVDEFQDTNITQYELMRAIAVAGCVTVVGDPDQSIYGWRSAEVGNLKKMQKDFSLVEQIFLEQNYRSTGSILRVSMAIVDQDKSRIQKSLVASHPAGITPTLRCFSSEQAEAAFIAGEIKRLVAHMGGLLRWGDFVILLRFNALSRAIESALQKEGIPSRVLGGHKFFERLEIKDLLAYLQLIDNPHFIPAFTRAVNTPSRGIGEKTLAELLARSEKAKISVLELVEKIHEGKTPDIKPPVKRKLASFVTNIRLLRKLANEDNCPADLIRRLVEVIEYQDHLRKTQPDWETRWENVQELITFASDVHVDVLSVEPSPEVSTGSIDESRDATPLRLFLQASMLSSEGDHQNEENDKEASQLLVEEGTFPFYRSDDIEEERRLLYVACTRAQSLLYLSHASQRKVAGETKGKDLTTFISAITKQNNTLFTDQLAPFSSPERAIIANVLDRSVPAEADVAKSVAELQVPSLIEQVISVNTFVQLSNDQASCFRVSFRSCSRSIVLDLPANFVRPAIHSRGAVAATTFTTSFPRPSPGNSTPQPPAPRMSMPNVPRCSNGFSAQQSSSYRKFDTALQTSQASSTSYAPPKPGGTTNTLCEVQNIAVSAPGLPQPNTVNNIRSPMPSPSTAGVKRRLGMGRSTTGYTNKKFKPP